MVRYEGIFFDDDTVDFIHSLEKNHLPIVNDEIHCTFKYHPEEDEIFDELVGSEIEVIIIGYGCDGNNSGFEIQLPDNIKEYYINYEENEPGKLKTPHITASLAVGAKALNTKNLKFEKLSIPYVVKGRFGYWIKEDNNEYLSFEKYKLFSIKSRMNSESESISILSLFDNSGIVGRYVPSFAL